MAINLRSRTRTGEVRAVAVDTRELSFDERAAKLCSRSAESWRPRGWPLLLARPQFATRPGVGCRFVGPGLERCGEGVASTLRPHISNKDCMSRAPFRVDWGVVPVKGQLKQVGSIRGAKAAVARAPWRLSLGAALLMLALPACYDVGMVADPQLCTPGQLSCVCDAASSCELGLECRQDRCVDPKTDATAPDPGTSSSQGPGSDGSTSTQSSPESKTQEPSARCDDGVQNGLETDLDCGGGQCIACVLGQHCLLARDCRSNSCVAGVCQGQDPECVVDDQCKDSNACTVDRCISNTCQHTLAPEDSPCDDQSACTVGDVCKGGVCQGESAILLEENFDRHDDFEEWSFEHYTSQGSSRSTWEIGRAKSSRCGSDGGFGNDPATDHSERHRNRVLGSDIGGCHHHGFAPAWDCAWTPYLDASKLEDDIELSFWRHLHAPGWENEAGVRHRVLYRLWGEYDEKVLELMDSPLGYDDADWTRQNYVFKRPTKTEPQEFSVGICYQRSGKVSRFAGWSVDDVLIRQKGCKEGG